MTANGDLEVGDVFKCITDRFGGMPGKDERIEVLELISASARVRISGFSLASKEREDVYYAPALKDTGNFRWLGRAIRVAEAVVQGDVHSCAPVEMGFTRSRLVCPTCDKEFVT